MKPIFRALVAVLLFGVGAIPCAAAEEIGKPSLELSFEETQQGLTYAVYGESVISQKRLRPDSPLDLSDLPEGVIVKAFLYWAGELEPRKSADTKVELKSPDGSSSVIHAEKVWTDVVSGLVYVCKAEVGERIKERGTYTVSHIDADPLDPADIAGKVQRKAHYTLGGWALVVIFKDSAIKNTATVQLYDGLLYIPSGDAQREGRFGLERVGHDISKEDIYSETVLKMERKGPVQADMLDLTVVAGLGRPWDGGSILFDGEPISGKEDFTGSAGFSWDISRDIVHFTKGSTQHALEFLPDYNSVMPVAVVAKFGSLENSEILRIAASYIRQAERVDQLEFFTLRDSTFEGREFAAKDYVKDILQSKAAVLFKTAKGARLSDPYGLHAELGRLYLEKNIPDLAEMQLKEAARSEKADAQVFINLSRLYYEKRQMDEAVRWLGKAKDLSGNDPLIHLNLGICSLQMGFVDDAVAQFEEAIRLDPVNPAPYHCLVGIYESQGRIARKVAVLKRLERTQQDDRK